MAFQSIKLLIFVTCVSSIALAQPLCKRELNELIIPLMEIRNEVVHKGPDEGTVFIQPKDFLFHFETVSKELRESSSSELMTTFEDLVQVEQKKHGGLTGIRRAKITAKGLVQDMGVKNEYKREDYSDFSDKHYEEMKARGEGNPTSAGLFSNYFRNELSALMAYGVYPTYFKRELNIAETGRPIRLILKSDNMTPTSDFRIYTSLVQREVLKRLTEDPKKFFKEIGLEFPKDDQILMKSIGDLRKLLYAE